MLSRQLLRFGRPSARGASVLVGVVIAALSTSTLTMRAADKGAATGAALNPAEPKPLAPTADHVAREIMQLQQQFGGSIVSNSPGLAALPARRPDQVAASATPVAPATAPGRATTAVDSLRQASWQLDTSAHRLEQFDLYDQADALRQLAARLRQDARDRVAAAVTITAN
ncbi:MAG: hypothetical protein MK171_05815 [Pirellulales bacterium]|nr:hypothetical protein [Pirellulales bacterium]